MNKILSINESLRKKDLIYAYPFIFPAIILIIFIYAYSLFQVIRYSFIVEAGEKLLYSFRNYMVLFQDDLFKKALLVNIKFLSAVPILVIFAIFLTILIYQGVKGWKIFRSFMLFPYIIAVPIAGLVFTYFFRLNGPLNVVLRFLHLDFLIHDWMVESNFIVPSIIMVIIWREVGFGVTLFLARLASIEEGIIESAKIDGANWFQLTIHIIIPQLYGVIQFYIVIEVIAMLGWLFDYIYIMLGGSGGAQLTWTMDFYVYKMMIQYSSRGLASAGSVILLLFALIIMFLRYRIAKRAEIE